MCRSQFVLKTCSDRVAVIRGERRVVRGSSVQHYQCILSLTYPDIIQKFKQFKNFVLFGSHSFLIFPWYIIMYSVVACQLSCEQPQLVDTSCSATFWHLLLYGAPFWHLLTLGATFDFQSNSIKFYQQLIGFTKPLILLETRKKISVF